MATTPDRIDIQRSEIRVRDSMDDREAIQRFRDLREDLRRRARYEVTNADVLDILLDCYWVHRENGPVPFERLRPSGGRK